MIINRLKRAEGQLRGIQKMIEEEQPCRDIMIQLTAVRSSIDRVMGIVAAENLKHCLLEDTIDNQDQEAKIQEAIDMIIKK